MDIEEFKIAVDALDNPADLTDFCRKQFLHGIPFVFRGEEENYYEFRKRIGQKFDIAYHEVLITGSAKLGFSPHKAKEFDYDSDIDVSIVSNSLFEKFMDNILDFQWNLREAREKVQFEEIKMYNQFLHYIALGWMRPDKLPVSFQMKVIKGDWFNYFESLSNGGSEVGNYKVNCGVFKSYSHLELYLEKGLVAFQKVKIDG
ncbi:MAG: hypothetical protein ABJE63_13590 [Lentilitoribacter sp.]|uniref:hypothetical protein n=1 Tax=Hyphomonas sp. TaxID=87 RepID=UPI0032887C33